MDPETRITKTLELFALQSSAVTMFEVWRFLVRPLGEHGTPHDSDSATVDIADVQQVLTRLVLSGQVVEHFGYYAPVGRDELLTKRWTGYQYGEWREKRIRRFCALLRYIPFVEGAALAGSQALGAQREESDIDLLILTKPGWLWLPRTLVTAYFQACGIRRHGAYIANRVCLNHYISGTKDMREGRNWYTALEYTKLRPLVGSSAVALFQKRNEEWLADFFPNFSAADVSEHKAARTQIFLERAFEALGGRRVEKWLGQWQSGRIHKNEPHIIVAEDELSFHPNSKQDALLEAFKVD